jgi:transketolase
MHFGVREHAMGAIANGISVHGGLMSYTATFLAFYDYMRPSIRLAALMGLNTIYIFTHDSIGLGEDGPTHQPIEHLVGMRAVPNLTVIRPADAHETFQAWEYAINNNVGPTSLILSRQNLPIITSDHEKVSYGAYVLYQFNDEEIPEIILIATGSEVKIALEVANILSRKNINSRVVSMPSWEIFEKQESSYKESVLPSAVRNRVSIEASATIGWDRYIGLDGLSIGIDRFGASAPAQRIFSEYGFDPEKISIKITSLFQLS